MRDRAKTMLARAGSRAASLGAPAEAEGYFDEAASLSSSPLEQAELTERAGQMAELGGRLEDASAAFERAIAAFREIGQERDAARCEARLAGIEYDRGRLDDAIGRMTAVRDAMAGWSPDANLATVDAQLGRFLALANREREAVPVLEEALELAEHLGLRQVFAEALNSRGITLTYRGRVDEAITVLRRSLEVALEEDLGAAALRAYNNLCMALLTVDRFVEALEFTSESIELARRMGARRLEMRVASGMAALQSYLGRWDEAMTTDALFAPSPTDDESSVDQELGHHRLAVVSVLLQRGETAEARRRVESTPEKEHAQQEEAAALHLLRRGELLFADHQFREALETAERVVEMRRELTLTHPMVKRALVLAIESALALEDATAAEGLLHIVEEAMPGQVTPWLRAHAARLAARAAYLSGSADLGAAYEAAEDGFRRLEARFDLGVTLLDHAEWLVATGAVENADRCLTDAAAIFEDLRAGPWAERVRMARRSLPSPAMPRAAATSLAP